MFRYKKLFIYMIIADLILLAGLFALCILADRERGISGSIKAGQGDGNTSPAMEDNVENSVQKSSVFDENIYDRQVIPSGQAVGIYMKTDGVMVVDICSFINDEGQSCCPAKNILKMGDYITSIDGRKISKRSELLGEVAGCDGKTVTITYVRNGKEHQAKLQPEQNQNGNYLIGTWVKDDVSGIGTITFIDGGSFMALGHSVSDVDTGMMMSCSNGGIYSTDITSICKSYSMEPGRLQGSIAYRRDLIGIVEGNSSSGIFGYMDTDYLEENYGDAEKMYIAHSNVVTTGTAYIYSRLTGKLEKYNVEIENIDKAGTDKNIEFRVTDEKLLSLTGGIVQGMSGSPIIKDGKIIGAVTHVFVDDPTKGYGIFIENMLAN